MIDRFIVGLAPMLADPKGGEYMTVLFDTDMDPYDRHYRFGMMIDAELRIAGFGCSNGGGTLYGTSDDDAEPEAIYPILDVDATEVDGARRVLRDHLPELGCPAGTLLLCGDNLEDRFDGTIWHLSGPRSVTEWPM